jgi:3-hydroxyacyl-CoA dehydrogenase
MGDGVLLLEFHGKVNALGVGVVELAVAALERLEGSAHIEGMVIGNQGCMFSAGGNIVPSPMLSGGDTSAVAADRIVRSFQDLLQGVRYCTKPVVAAPFDRTLGGGAEVVLAASRIVAHIELYIGLVEVSAGLVPAGGGCKEMLRRVMNPVMAFSGADPIPVIMKIFNTIGTAKVSVSAVEARDIGYLRPADRIVMDRDILLGEAKREVMYLAQSGYAPPRPEKIYAGGRDMLAALRSSLYQMREGHYIDYVIGEKLSWIISGGDISSPEWVDEQYILDLERVAFLELIQTDKSMERIMHTVKTGKLLRN